MPVKEVTICLSKSPIFIISLPQSLAFIKCFFVVFVVSLAMPTLVMIVEF